MKNYYKNWHQHYLDQQEERKKDELRGYYTNVGTHETDGRGSQDFEPKSNNHIPHNERRYLANNSSFSTPMTRTEKKKQKAGFFGWLLPVAVVIGFIGLWYHLDMGPVRHYVNEVMIFIGVRDDSEMILGHHFALLDKHVSFAEDIGDFIGGSGALSFDDLNSLFDELREAHNYLIEISGDAHQDAMRFWAFKIASSQQMMNEISIDEEGLELAFERFLTDQEGISELIRSEISYE